MPLVLLDVSKISVRPYSGLVCYGVFMLSKAVGVRCCSAKQTRFGLLSVKSHRVLINFIVTVALVSLLAEQTFTFGARTGTFNFTRG